MSGRKKSPKSTAARKPGTAAKRLPAAARGKPFPKRAHQAQEATRPDKPKKRDTLKPTGTAFVLVPKAGAPGAMLADPFKMKAPPTTTDAAEAKQLHGRGTVHKFLKAHPEIARAFNSQRVA